MLSLLFVLICPLVLLVAVLFIVRLWMVLPSRKSAQQTRQPTEKVKTCVVLGSGGHTSEMCALIQSLDTEKYEFEFFVAQSDEKSEPFVRAFFTKHQRDNTSLIFHQIPRSREVKQSYLTSVFTTLKALVYTTKLVVSTMRPDLVLTNGPGTCVPVVFASYLLRIFGLKHVKFIYVESAARVKSLSLTGKILYPFVDRFLVQWPDLVAKYRGAEYIGRLC